MYKKVAFILLLISTGLLSCKEDFLEKQPQDKLTQENFPSNASDALTATNAAYEVLRFGTYHRGFYPIDDIMSDDALKGSSPGDLLSDLQPFDIFDHNVTNTFILNWWRALYTGVRRTNVVIDRVPRVAMDEEVKNRYVSEARFLRALYYFDLARAYGGVPLVKKSEVSADFTRSTVDETYDFIESDLRQAIQSLPVKSDYAVGDLGRATRGAAKALLARVYLYQKRYDSASFFAEEVILSQQYELESAFSDAFSLFGEFGLESVFEAGGIGNQGGIAAGNNEFTIAQGVRGVPNRGIGTNRPSLDLINSFEVGDPRMQATVIFVGETLDGIAIVGDSQTPDTTSTGQPETYNQKIWIPGTTPFSNTGHNRRIIRYSEVLLIAAEAFNQEGNSQKALTYLNRVRERAREGDPAILPDITETNREALEALILEERRHELAMEGHRFWDVVRMGKAQEIFGPLGFQNGKHELLPIPQSERDITNGLLDQNPNWN